MTEEDVNDGEVYIESRTAAEVDDRCGMRYWWNFQEAGTGIVPAVDPDALAVGKETHHDLELVAGLDSLKPDVVESHAQAVIQRVDGNVLATEKSYRRAGWLAAFALLLEPRIRQEFESIQTEAEIVLDRDPLFVPITPDRLLRSRATGKLVYREWKSTITASAKWLASWPFAIQIHLGMTAIEEEFDEPVAYGQVMGMLKGDIRDGHLVHPFVWGWRKGTDWTTDYQVGRRVGYSEAPVWDYPGGITGWVRDVVGTEAALAQFPHSYPVFLNKRQVEDWINRRFARQVQIEAVRDSCRTDWKDRVIYFEPRTAQCRPSFGEQCPYLSCCWNAAMNENPLASDQYVPRVPHHELERIGLV